MTEQVKQTYYITTPIYYPSGRLHIGNSYSTLAADALARYHRLFGKEVFFLTGTDEHGQKIQNKAEELGIEPQAYVDQMAEKIKALWQTLEISNDYFIRTTDDYHEQAVQDIFQKLLDKGDIYLGEYEGWYSVSDEEYFTQTQLVEVYKDESGKVIGGVAPSGHQVELVKEECYFFKLSKYADQLLAYYEANPDFIKPSFRKNELVNNFIKPGLEDLALTRTTFTWGVPVKSDPKHVIYVWIDALANYITALGYGSDDTSRFDKFWPANVHILGKDITRFHMIYWPILLMALELPLPKQVYGHGWIVMKDGKMSKSKGNVIYPETLIDRYGLDATRFYLLREMSQGNDTVFTPEDFVSRLNYELANDLGNLLNRTISMINRYCQGLVPNKESDLQANEADESFETYITDYLSKFHQAMEDISLNHALDHIMSMVSRANKYIDETEPWVLAKDPDKVAKLNSVMYHLAASLRLVAHLLRPFMTQTPQEIFRQLGLSEQESIQLNNLSWTDFPDQVQVIDKGVPIFPRLEAEEEIAFIQEAMKATGAQVADQASHPTLDDPNWDPESVELRVEETPNLDFNQFIQTEMRVAEVIDVQPVAGSNKLLRFRLDAGDSGHRQILSGIAKEYPDYQSLIGMKLVIVANLKPRKMMGYISQGMILSSEANGVLHLIQANPEAENGSLIG